MISSVGEGAFLRFWLPLILLGLMVVLLFPALGPRRDRQAREAWDGVVILVSLQPAPEEELHLIATLPLRSRNERTERLIVGDVRIAAGTTSVPILLATPSGSELGRRLTRRVDRDFASPERIRPTFVLHRAADVSGDRATLVGTFLRGEELVDADGAARLPTAILEIPDEIRVDDVRRRRWPGSPASFSTDWRRFQQVDPGGLAAFIHARRTLPSDGVGAPERAGIEVPGGD